MIFLYRIGQRFVWMTIKTASSVTTGLIQNMTKKARQCTKRQDNESIHDNRDVCSETHRNRD